MTQEERDLLSRLVEQWKRWARAAFRDASREKDEFGKRFIEHGAVCYTNCAIALTEALAAFEEKK